MSGARAIALCIEREGIARALLRDRPGCYAVPPALARWHDASLPPLQTDLHQARRLLEEAGWRLGADGALA
jgi:peptide/nickel transport system substrate-binding protein